MRRYTLGLWLTALGAGLGLLAMTGPVTGRDQVDALQEAAIKDAVRQVAPCVVKIEVSGGTDVVKTGGPGTGPVRPGLVRRGVGPTTGLIVSAEGHIISSAFNFANNPSQIRVTVPGMKERKVARIIATDQTRMLTLLKLIDVPAGTKLPIPVPAPPADIQIGLTAIAVGRTLASETDGPPSVSVGIISALDRIWGKTIQTDAKVSPTNYGGPLVDLQGRVQGVLVPASPQADGELAGFEWYDSGIGFAVPLADVFVALPRMLKGTEKDPVVLKRGFLGITMQKAGDMYEAAPVIGTVAPGSAAEKAGLKPGDTLKAIDGKPVLNFAQVQHQLGKRYEGDAVSIELERDKKKVSIARVVLGLAEVAQPSPFLGILPLRDDAEKGVEVRYVYSKSPADLAGLKEGDRIMKVSSPLVPPGGPLVEITRGRDQLLGALEVSRPGQETKLEVKRKAGGKTETLTLKLAEMPDMVPEKLPDPEKASAKKALVRPGEKPGKKPVAKDKDKEKEKEKEKEKKPETGLLKRATPAADHTYWIYVPDSYDPNVACAVVVWLHPLGKNKEKDIEDLASSWSSYCDDHNFILICPQSDNPRGWTPNETDFVLEAVRNVATTYTVDQRRIVVHGMGVGGEMALYLGFQARTLFRGVATVGAVLGNNPREKVVSQPLSFFLVAGGKDPLKASIAQTRDKLIGFKYPTILREVSNIGHEYIDGRSGVPTLEELVRWIDSLDRM